MGCVLGPADGGGDNTGLLGEFLLRTAEEFVEVGGGDGDAGARLRLGEFLTTSHHVNKDAWLCGVLAYL